jgi:predicted MPP superfamily phosphohydrolase
VPRLGQFLIFLFVALAIIGGMHGYIWMRLVRDPILPEPWRRLATWTLVGAAILIPVGLFAARVAGRQWVRVIPTAAFIWLGVAFLLFASLVAIDLVRASAWGLGQVADWLRSLPERPPDPDRRQFVARVLAGGAAAAVGGVSAFSYRSATGPAVIEEVPVKLATLPPALSGYSIAQITDLHVGPTIREREVRRVVEQTNALKPDAIVITGDLVDGSTRELGPIIAELGRLSARQGVWFITGNHEYYSGADEWISFLRGLGIRTLRNQRVELGDEGPGGARLSLAGVDDWSAHGFGGDHGLDLPRAVAGRDPERPLILLAHQPRDFEGSVRAGVDLQLSGHTHGGQIFPFSLAVAATFPYVKGLHRATADGRSGQIYVSRGTGYWGPPMRLLAPPEISRVILTS